MDVCQGKHYFCGQVEVSYVVATIRVPTLSAHSAHRQWLCYINNRDRRRMLRMVGCDHGACGVQLGSSGSRKTHNSLRRRLTMPWPGSQQALNMPCTCRRLSARHFSVPSAPRRASAPGPWSAPGSISSSARRLCAQATTVTMMAKIASTRNSRFFNFTASLG